MEASPDVQEVISTFRVLSELPPDSLGAYVISMAKTASDVLAVVLLQRECGVKVGGCKLARFTCWGIWIDFAGVGCFDSGLTVMRALTVV